MRVEWWDRWQLSVFDAPAAPSPATARFAPVRLGEQETIVFYGDSITEQNLYSAYLETFLLSRFPQKKLASFNFGWGGDTASGGDKRFARDVSGVKPSLGPDGTGELADALRAPQGAILWSNPAFAQITGYSYAETLGQNPRMFQSGQINVETYADLWLVKEFAYNNP